MNLFLKVCILANALFILNVMVDLIKSGIRARTYQNEYERTTHRRYRWKLYLSFLFLIFLVTADAMVRGNVAERGQIGTLLVIHWVADITLIVLTLLIEFRFNGNDRPDVHSAFVYGGFVPSMVVVLFTGTLLTLMA